MTCNARMAQGVIIGCLVIFFILCIVWIFCVLLNKKPRTKEGFHFELSPGVNSCMPFTKPGEQPSPRFCCEKEFVGRPGGFEMTAGWWRSHDRPDSYTQEECDNLYWSDKKPVQSTGYSTLGKEWCEIKKIELF